MARQKKEPETLETFTQKCMQRPMAKIIEELFNTRTELMECRRAIGGLKRRKESGVTDITNSFCTAIHPANKRY